MKRKELLKKLAGAGCVFLRHGASHDLYKNPKTGKKQPIPRHNEIDEHLAKHILNILT
jgi:predicted RNA binding protein YcfA (HicA-like mRNA interferase family)